MRSSLSIKQWSAHRRSRRVPRCLHNRRRHFQIGDRQVTTELPEVQLRQHDSDQADVNKAGHRISEDRQKQKCNLARHRTLTLARGGKGLEKGGLEGNENCIDLVTLLRHAFGITEQIFTGVALSAATNVFVGVTRSRESLGLAMRRSVINGITAWMFASGRKATSTSVAPFCKWLPMRQCRPAWSWPG